MLRLLCLGTVLAALVACFTVSPSHDSAVSFPTELAAPLSPLRAELLQDAKRNRVRATMLRSAAPGSEQMALPSGRR